MITWYFLSPSVASKECLVGVGGGLGPGEGVGGAGIIGEGVWAGVHREGVWRTGVHVRFSLDHVADDPGCWESGLSI